MSEIYFKLPSNAVIDALVARAEATRRQEIRAMVGRALRAIGATFRLVEQALVSARDARALYDMTDQQLARRGLSRHDIASLISKRLDDAAPRDGAWHANDDRHTANNNATDARPADEQANDRSGRVA